jgi:hypothetical protein
MVAVGVLAVTLLLKSTMYFFAIANSFLTFSEFSRSKLFCEVLVTESPCIAPWRREATRALHLRGVKLRVHCTLEVRCTLPHYVTSLHYPHRTIAHCLITHHPFLFPNPFFPVSYIHEHVSF